MDDSEVDEVKKQEFHVSPKPEALESKQDEPMELVKPTDREMQMDEFKDECGENSQLSKSESPSSIKEETQTDENSQEEQHPEKIPKQESAGDDSQEKSQESVAVLEKNQDDEETPKLEETEETEANDKIEPDQHKLLVANGAVPKSEKPVVAAINKRIRQQKSRSKRKTFVAMYQSEISDNKIGIKLCIKKSETAQQTAKRSRKRSRKSRQKDVTDSDDSEYERRGRKEKSNNNTDKLRKVTEPKEQSVWGNALPEPVLLKIFNYVVQQEGCMPTLFRLGRVCTLWRRVSLVSCLWRSMDLSLCIKERYRTELKLKWLIENRLKKECTELNVSNWKISDVQCVLNLLVSASPGLVGITLAGWKHFTSDHLMFLAEEFTKLERIDLSSINLESHVSKSAVGFQSLCKARRAVNFNVP